MNRAVEYGVPTLPVGRTGPSEVIGGLMVNGAALETTGGGGTLLLMNCSVTVTFTVCGAVTSALNSELGISTMICVGAMLRMPPVSLLAKKVVETLVAVLVQTTVWARSVLKLPLM